MKHLIVTSLALFIGIFVGFGISYTVRQPETAPAIRQNEKPDTAVGIGEPVIIFAPGGLFSAEEKNKLTRDVTQPAFEGFIIPIFWTFLAMLTYCSFELFKTC